MKYMLQNLSLYNVQIDFTLWYQTYVLSSHASSSQSCLCPAKLLCTCMWHLCAFFVSREIYWLWDSVAVWAQQAVITRPNLNIIYFVHLQMSSFFSFQFSYKHFRFKSITLPFYHKRFQRSSLPNKSSYKNQFTFLCSTIITASLLDTNYMPIILIVG